MPTAALRREPSEAQFTAQVIRLAQLLGWAAAHFRPAMTAKGWRTAVQGDGKGFPDLVLARGPRLVVAELKVGRNPLTAEQAEWLDRFRMVPGVEVFEWRPADWDLIEATLRREV